MNHNFTKVFLFPLILVGLVHVVEAKPLLVHDRVDVVRVNGTIHVDELRFGPDQNTTDDAPRR